MKTDRELLELAELHSLLSYCKDTGEFVWIKSNSNASVAGAIAGRSVNSDGYRQIVINKCFYKAHRLAWFYAYGEWPNQIDHINGNRSDNRLCNLRNVDARINSQNKFEPQKNNSTGFLGVLARPSGRFSAEIRVNGKKIHIGTFNTPEQASSAYLQAKYNLHPGAARAAAAIGESMP